MSWIEDYNKSRKGEVGRSFVYAALGLGLIISGGILIEQNYFSDKDNKLEKEILYDTIPSQIDKDDIFSCDTTMF